MVKLVATLIGRPPKSPVELMRNTIDQALRDEAERMDVLFVGTTAGFRTVKPSFVTSKVKKIAFDREIWVYTARNTISNGKYSWINFGTGPRDIIANAPKGPMVFPANYDASTTPGRLSSGQRRKHGPKQVTRIVRNHSIAPRRFDKSIVKRRKGFFKRVVQGRINKVAKRVLK